MKKLIIFFFIILGSTTLFAQIDSSAVKINASIQARDLELIAGLLPYAEEYEDIADAAKAKFRTGAAPTNTTAVAIDSVAVGTWFKIWVVLKQNPYAVAASSDSRLETILRAKNNTWLTNQINSFISRGTVYYNNLRAIGRRRLIGK